MKNINSFGIAYHNPSVEPRQSTQRSTDGLFPDFDQRLERVKATFAAIKNKYPPGWRRKIVLGWLADYHGIPKADFRSSFETWQIEEVDR